MEKRVDARGMNCPKPVIETKKVLDQLKEGSMITIVDNEVAMQNVSKLAKSLQFEVEVNKKDQDYHISIFKGEKSLKNACSCEEERDLVLLITKDTLGEGERELGKILIKGYIYALAEYTPYPKTILFMNSGVKLTVKDSPVLEYLKHLEEEGVEILSCGTCLDYYHLKDELGVGSISNMYSILDALHSAKNRITL